MLLFVLCLFTVIVVVGVWFVFLKTSQKVVKVYRKKVETNDEQYKLAMKSINIIKWVAYPATGVVEINEHYTQLNSLSGLENLINRETFYNFIQPEHRERVRESFENLKAGRISIFHEEYCFCMSGEVAPMWVETYATVNDRDPEGKPLTLIGSTISIDKRKKRENELQKATKKANEVNDMKTAFLANMSHEVRTPLNQIVGFSQALLLAQSEDDRKQCISLIEQNSNALLGMFDTILTISRLESNTYAFSPMDASIKEVFQDLEQAACTNHPDSTVTLEVEPGLPDDLIHTDTICLHQLMGQLLSNAFKFTREGKITMGYKRGADGTFRFHVKDTGCGIDEENQKQIFEQFTKVDSFVQGAGLGLVYAKMMVEKMGGEIGCHSVPGIGSEFWFTLPGTKVEK